MQPTGISQDTNKGTRAGKYTIDNKRLNRLKLLIFAILIETVYF